MTDSKMLAQALYERACISLAEKRNADASEDLKKALKVLGTKSDSELRRLLTLALQTVEAAISQQGTVSVLPPGSAKPSDESGLVPDIGNEAKEALNAAMEHMMADRLVAATVDFEQALHKECVQGNPAARAIVQANLGDILRTLGETDEAIEVLKEAIESALLAKNSYLEHMARLNLGIAQHVKGSWAESRSNLERALKLAPDAVDSPGRGRVLIALANVYRDSAEYERAENMFREAASLSDQSSDQELPGAIEQNWGNLYFVQGQRHWDQTIRLRHWHESIPHYEKALMLARQRRDGRSQGIALHMLGNILRRLGDVKRAIELLQQSVAIEDVCPSEVARAGRLNDLATAEQDYGQVPQAIEHYHQAVQLFRKHGISSPDVAGCLENLGVLLVRCGKIEEGRDIMLEASRMDNLMIAQAFAIASETARLEFLRYAEDRLSDIISLVAARGLLENDATTVRACADVVIRRKGVTLDALSLQRDLVASRKHPELADAIKELKQIRMRLAQMIFAGERYHWDSSLRPKPTPKAAELAAQRSRLEHQIAKYTPFIALDEQLRRADAKAVTGCLPKDSALVEFMRFKHFDFPPPDRKPYWVEYRYVAVVLTADEASDIQVVDLGEAEAIDQMIADLRERIKKDDEAGVADIGTRLRRAVLDPLAPSLKGCARLLIAPDSGLTSLPFEILPTEDGRYLIDHYSISYLSAGRDLLCLNTTTQSKANLPVVIADPDFDLSDDAPRVGKETENQTWRHSRHLGQAIDRPFFPLPNTAKEGESIAKILGVQPWLREAALEARLKSYTSPRILHLATHGFFLDDQDWLKVIFGTRAFDPATTSVHTNSRQPVEATVESPLLRSCIALAGANTFLRFLRGESLELPPPSAEDGILTAEDVTGLNLSGTELVVLSACETGLGVPRTGEGVFGLRRAFVQAGARTLVMSLWCVPDEATMELMTEFYRGLLAGKGRAEALREAQLVIRQQYPKAPRYWGAFICQGDPSAINWQK
jgi:CHAT domain-containing protein/Tfp pilus assembly protein PilF